MPQYALKLVIIRIRNILPEIITPSVSPYNEYFGVIWLRMVVFFPTPQSPYLSQKTEIIAPSVRIVKEHMK